MVTTTTAGCSHGCANRTGAAAAPSRETLGYGRPRPLRAPEPLSTGSTLAGTYRLRAVIGRGSTGTVLRAEDLALRREVAIKALLPCYAAEAPVARRFRREAEALAGVRHENVVQVFAFGEHRGLPYFVMELLSHGTVAELLERASRRGERLPLDLVFGLLGQVCRGLQALHEAGLVHNDVKPANLLLGPRGRVALCDLGLVQAARGACEASSADVAGTPMYLAPELILGRTIPAGQRHRADIYALGVVAYELLTGAGPFPCDSITELFNRHLDDAPPGVCELRPDLPGAFDPVLRRALAKDPADRPASCDELLAALVDARSRSRRFWTRTGRRLLAARWSAPYAPSLRCLYRDLTA